MYAPRVWGGGVESHVCELTAEMLARNVEVTLAVCSRFGRTTGRKDKLISLGAQFIDLGEHDDWGIDRIRDLVASRQQLRGLGRFDTIVCHGVGITHIFAAAARHGARLVWHDHGSGGERITNEREFSPPELMRFPWLFRQFLKNVDAVITGSEQGCKNLRDFQMVRNDTHIIPPLSVLPKSDGAPRQQRSPGITCGNFGNLGPEKGTESLLRIWADSDLSGIRLLLFGNDHEGRYERLAKSMGLRNVVFRGPYCQNEFVRLAEEVDFAIIASPSEGYALVAIELMACGVPLVATKVGGCPELDPTGKNVILVDHQAESVQSGILRMVEQIRNGAVDRRAIQERALEIYDRDALVDRYLEVIGV
jgi:glycosyltransferase involved in cell wall biosynthesis